MRFSSLILANTGMLSNLTGARRGIRKGFFGVGVLIVTDACGWFCRYVGHTAVPAGDGHGA
jgi:hypothetical protein